jgi:two-component system, OmpR family, sensor kinase
MLRRLSIRARLTVAFVAALAIVLALAGLFVYLRTGSELTGAIDDGLEARAGDLTELVASGGPDSPELTGTLFEGEEGFSEIVTPDGEVVASTLGPSAGVALDAETLERATSGSVLLEDVDVPGLDGDARVLAQPAASPEGEVIVAAGASTGDRSEALAGIAGAFAIGAPLALALAGALGYLLATRALAPVESLRRRAAAITLERSGERLPLPESDDELHRLAETLNAMLDRIEASLERERVFVADASHELRTPLAILRAELELAGRPERTIEDLRAALASATEEVDRLSRLAEDLLVIARADQGRLPIKRERVDVADLLERMRARFTTRSEAAGREISVDAPEGLRADLDVIRMEQALGNLIDNALRHGSGAIGLSAARRDGFVRLDVTDHGPGFADGFADQAFERFSRAGHGRTGGGAGLGLAIVRAVAEAHGGGVSVVRTGAPATTLRIELPLERGLGEARPRAQSSSAAEPTAS